MCFFSDLNKDVEWIERFEVSFGLISLVSSPFLTAKLCSCLIPHHPECLPRDSPKYPATISAWALSMNIQSWFPLGLTGLISLQSKGLSRVFSNTTVWKLYWHLSDNSHTSIPSSNLPSELLKCKSSYRFTWMIFCSSLSTHSKRNSLYLLPKQCHFNVPYFHKWLPFSLLLKPWNLVVFLDNSVHLVTAD